MSVGIALRPRFEPWINPSSKPLIEFENVTKTFGNFTAVSDLSLKIYEREFFALLGPSGCGKTTLMRMLAGFENPTSGRILLSGTDLASLAPNHRPFNMMFQSYALFPHHTIFENIAFGLRRAGMAKADVLTRVDQMLALVQLKGLEHRKPHQLSGGQRQRVALARALARRPKLLLLDEPLAALDKKLRQETQLELMDIQEKLGTTFLIVTHDQEEAMTVASRIAVMNKGEMEQVATPADIYEHPNCRYVASFIGEVNMLAGLARKNALHAYEVKSLESSRPFTVASTADIADGENCWLAVRPEKITISKTKPKHGLNMIQGQVLNVAYLGNVSTYHVKTAGGTIITVQMTNLKRDAASRFTWEEQVWLSFDDTSAVLLNR